MSQKLDLKHSQQLVMTPQLQQAIKLLQLNNIELSEFVEEELEKNPLLEKDDSNPDKDQEERQEEQTETDEMQDAFDAPERQDFDAGSSSADIGSGGDLKFESTQDSFENRMSEEKTLRSHLTDQLNITFADERDRAIGLHLIDRLDESGYLREERATLQDRLGCSEERLTRVLTSMQNFDPAGVFAKDLSECLAIQLHDKGALDGPMQSLLDNLQLLGEHDLKTLQDICGVNETYLMDMVAEIKSLNPKPASDFEHLVVQTAVPDALMKRLPKNIGGGWRVELNHDTLPRVLINQEYFTQVSQSATKKQDKQYVNDQLSSANWLVRALDQRAQTILKVASALVEEQDAFFNYGIEFLRPLTLKDIAEKIDMHESTVSRVTTNKYIGTPRGIFELKFFFSTALVSSGGVAHSAESIKARIKSLIDNEDPKKILSDDKIVDILKEEKIDIARRTVAKYREAMHIGSSVLRRKQKKNAVK